MHPTRIDEKAKRGQKIRTEGPPEREKPVTGPGHKASYKIMSRGGAEDVSHSIASGKVPRP